MKILIVSKELPPDIGGAGVVAYNNAAYLSKMGHEVVILTSKSLKYKRTVTSDFKVVEVDNQRLWFVPFYRELKRYSGFDVFLFNDPHAIYIAGIFLTKNKIKKFICYLHGSEPELIYKNQTLLKRIFLFRYFYHKAMQKSDRIIAVSHFMKEKIFKSNFFEKSLRKKVLINYAGVNFDNVPKDKPGVKYTTETINILSVGRIIREKGYDKIAEVLGLVSKTVDFKWTVVGDGEFLSELKLKCEKLNISDRVVFSGRIERDDLHKFYKKADLFVVLSRLEESFSLAHLEAQVYGLPAVGLNHSGMKECIINGQTGFLLEQEAELVDLLKLRYFKLINKDDCIANSKYFSLENTVKKLEQTLLELSC